MTAMVKTMHIASEPSATVVAWGKLSRAIGTDTDVLKLHVANQLIGEKSYVFDKAFLDETKQAFDAPLELADFKVNFERERETINAWVEKQTESRIKNLLPKGALTKETRLVLVNAIYFLAKWANPFTDVTTDRAFFVSKSESKKLPTMSERATFHYAKVGNYEVIELAYRGGQYAMRIVLPTDVDGLATVEAGLTANDISDWRTAMKPTEILLHLPKFNLRPAVEDLTGALSKLGMGPIFDRNIADFTGIANPASAADRLFISAIFHKAFVEVNEQGTEAAAATAVNITNDVAEIPKPVTNVKVDHPFIFFIVDKNTDLVLFMGRVVDPSAS
jgi:serpin B